jgi:3-isopropylmalate dehydrogenase
LKFKIAQLSGDGIGPEVVAQAVKVLAGVGSKFGHGPAGGNSQACQVV